MPKRRAGDVFLNIPFAATHEYLYLSLIAGLATLRLTPRCVLEIPPQQNRLDRLFTLIGECAYSIHDLSYVKLSGGSGPRVPRFNMPFELGIAVAIAKSQAAGQRHQFSMFEAKPYRLQKSLSDVLGYDPYIHQGRAEGVLEALLNVFSHLPDAPDLADLQRVYRELRQFRQERLGQDVFQPKPFSKVLVAARELAAS
jgi:hypothetical protein